MIRLAFYKVAGSVLLLFKIGLLSVVVAVAPGYAAGQAQRPVQATLTTILAQAEVVSPAMITISQASVSSASADNYLTDKEIFQQASRLLEKNQAAEALVLLFPLENRLAGDPQFDYLLGTALLDAGYPGRATFVLERLALVQPDFAGSRLELARAYFELGDYPSAEREFNALLGLNPPANVQEVIIRYLDAINRQNDRYASQWSGYAQLGGGYDSNANSASDDDSFLGFALAERNQEQSSGYGLAALGIQWSQPIVRGRQMSPGLKTQWVSRLGVQHKGNFSAHFVDQTQYSAATSLVWKQQYRRNALSLSARHSELDKRFNYRSIAVQAVSNTQTGPNDYWLLQARLEQLRFARDIRVRDVNRAMATLGKRWTEVGANRFRISMQAVLGRDESVELGSSHARWLYGVNSEWLWPALGAMNLRFKANVLKSDYLGTFLGFDRDDVFYGASANVELPNGLGPGIDLQFTAGYRSNQSSLDLYQYDGAYAALFLTYRVE